MAEVARRERGDRQRSGEPRQVTVTVIASLIILVVFVVVAILT